MVTKVKEVTISFKSFIITVKDGTEDNFIEELITLCNKYQTRLNGTCYDYEILKV